MKTRYIAPQTKAAAIQIMCVLMASGNPFDINGGGNITHPIDFYDGGANAGTGV